MASTGSFSVAALSAQVYGAELVVRALGRVTGPVAWQVPVGAAVSLLAGLLLRPREAAFTGNERAAIVVGVGVSAIVFVSGATSGDGIGRLESEVMAAGLLTASIAFLWSKPGVRGGAKRLFDAAIDASRRPFVGWVGLMAVVAAAAFAWAWLLGAPLGHDEAVYALKARSWLEGTPATGFGIYRPIGMPAVAWAILQASGTETALRVFGLVGVVSLVAMTWWVARRFYGRAAAFVAAAALVGAPSLLRRTPEFLNDIATSALLLGIAYLIWRHFSVRESNHIVWSGPLAVATFYLRYGALAGLGAVALAALLVWPRRMWESRRLLGLAGLIFASGIAPHVLYSISETGSATGILEAAGDVAGPEYIGEGLLDFITWAPSQLAGPLAGLLGAIGIGTALVAVYLRLQGLRAHSGTMFLAAAGLLQIVVIGVLSHAEERFVFMAIAMLLIVGSGGVSQLIRRLTPGPRVLATLGVAIALGASYAVSLASVGRQLSGVSTSRAILVQVSEAVAPPPGSDCVVLTSSIPEISWYSRCATYRHDSAHGREQALRSDHAYIVLFDNRKDDGLRPHVEDLIALADPPIFLESAGGSVGDASIWTVSQTP